MNNLAPFIFRWIRVELQPLSPRRCPLEQWLPQLAVMPPVDAYTAAAASLARSVRGGATGVMVHLTRAMGQKPLPEEARDIARAAADVGVSIGFAISMRDRNPLIYGDHDALLNKWVAHSYAPFGNPAATDLAG